MPPSHAFSNSLNIALSNTISIAGAYKAVTPVLFRSVVIAKFIWELKVPLPSKLKFHLWRLFNTWITLAPFHTKYGCQMCYLW